MNTTLPPLGEITTRGERIYQERLERILEPAHHGHFAVINVDTGEYEVAETVLDASNRAKARWPGVVPLFAVRVGFPTLFHIGGRKLARSE